MTFRPITHRVLQWFADHWSVAPAITGVVATIGLGGFAFWFCWFVGIVDEVRAGRQPNIAVRAPVTLYMMLGYLPMANYYVGKWSAEALDAVQRHASLNDVPELFPRKLANGVGAIGAVVMSLLFVTLPSGPFSLLRPWLWPADFTMPLVGLVFLGWFYFRFMFLLVWNAIAISETAQHIHRIDLLDASLVKPYSQHGVRSSLLAVVGLSISANLWLDPNSPTAATLTTLIMLVAAAVLALVLPTWGVHLRLKAEKHAELKQIRAAISARLDPHERSVEDAQQLRADLAMERRIMEISEWPFDAGSYGRVALYLFLGLGSWVGAALVERLLETLG